MPDYRYHIHVACVPDDPLLITVQDDVAIFFESRAFLTKDLVLARVESASYSWRCINAADAVLVLIGNSYGRTNASGVSQLHVSYTNAKTKNKPMLIFVHADVLNKDNNRSLLDLVALLETQEGGHIYHFDENTDFFKLLETAFNTLNLDKSKGWHMSATTKNALIALPNAEGQLGKEPIKKEPPKKEILKDKSLLELDEFIHAKTSANSNASFKPSLRLALELDAEFSVSCTAHAFRGGTLIEVSFVVPFRWQQIVMMLASVVMPFSEQGLGRALNESVDKALANQIVSRQYPDVHAVSRIQVVKADTMWILDELELAGWIEPSKQSGFWQASAKAIAITK